MVLADGHLIAAVVLYSGPEGGASGLGSMQGQVSGAGQGNGAWRGMVAMQGGVSQGWGGAEEAVLLDQSEQGADATTMTRTKQQQCIVTPGGSGHRQYDSSCSLVRM
jgi:hypothetical protein